MTNYWIFIVKDHKFNDSIVSALTVVKNRVEHKFWTLNKKAPYIKRLSVGDKVVFYATGIEGRGFCGRGELATRPHPLTPDQRFYLIGKPSMLFDLAVEFSYAECWSKIKPIEEFVGKLSFLKGRDDYTRCFRGSIKAISPEDYEIIVSEGAKS